MWFFIVRWCQSWRGRDVVMTLIGTVVMIGGMAALVDQGAGVLSPLLIGVALLWRTPLAQYPFDLGPPAPRPFTAVGTGRPATSAGASPPKMVGTAPERDEPVFFTYGPASGP